jgi:hypothetical protein
LRPTSNTLPVLVLYDVLAIVVVSWGVAGAAVHGPEEPGGDGGEVLVRGAHVAFADAERLHQQLRRVVQVLQRHLPAQLICQKALSFINMVNVSCGDAGHLICKRTFEQKINRRFDIHQDERKDERV